MKRINVFALVLAMLAFASLAVAEVPQMINYQGRLTNNSGNPVPDGVYSFKFSIYDASTEGNVLWTSLGFIPIQVENGLFNHLLGSTNPIPDSVGSRSSLWLGITVNLDQEITPRTRLVSVMFSYRAQHADAADTATRSLMADSATSAGLASHAASSDTSLFSFASLHSLNADSSAYSSVSHRSVYADTAFALAETHGFRRITENTVYASTTDTASWIVLAELTIPANEVLSYVHVISQVGGSAAYNNGSDKSYGALRMTIDGVEKIHCAPASPAVGQNPPGLSGSETFMGYYYSPTPEQRIAGFSVKIEGRKKYENLGSGAFVQAWHVRTDIWGF